MPRLIVFVMLSLAFGLPGLGGASALARQRAAAAEPADRRVVAFPGRTLIVPLAGTAGETAQSGWRPGRAPKVEWGSDRAEADLRFFAAPAQDALAFGWLPSAGEWTSRSIDQPPPSPSDAGFWALIVDASREAFGKSLRIDGRVIPTMWLETPQRFADAARLPRPEATRDSRDALVSLLQNAAHDPFRRWRAALALDRLDAEAELPLPSDPAVAALARQNEDRWRSALAVLSGDDADLCAEVLARATAIVASPDGPLLPAWSLDESGLALLRDELLDPESAAARRTERARSWLQTDPGAVAWVIDDAGELAGAGAYALVGVANLGRTHAVASLAVEGEAGKNPVRLPGHAAVALRAFFDPADASQTIGSAIIARAGAWSRPLPIGRGALFPTPPGLVLGPLLADWDLASWRAGAPTPVIGDRAAVALLSPAPDARSWDLYIECRFPPGAPPQREVVRIHLGPREGETQLIEVGPGAPGPSPSVNSADRWRAIVRLPLDPGTQRIRIGLERVEDSGRRSAWPRPMMPGQARGPGRAVIDLTAWGGLHPPTP